MAFKDHWDALIAAAATMFVGIWNNRKIERVRVGVNGVVDKLMRSTHIAGYGEGQQREREDQGKREEGKENKGGRP